VKRRIILGTYVLSSGYYDAYYLRAQKVRELIRQDFAKAFEKVDALVSPTSPVAAFKLGERTNDPLQMYLADIFTDAGNLAGICGISLPCGFAKIDNRELPIGLQFLGQALDEARICRLRTLTSRAPTGIKRGRRSLIFRRPRDPVHGHNVMGRECID
jgi:aspartyl-tRNA(Asn)/glutamyl-tRNA(Gln) amidotransferase subunit A